MITFKVPSILDAQTLWIAFMILSGVIGAETGIIHELSSRVGGVKQLFRITASIAENRLKKSADKTPNSNKHPKQQDNFKTSIVPKKIGII